MRQKLAVMEEAAGEATRAAEAEQAAAATAHTEELRAVRQAAEADKKAAEADKKTAAAAQQNFRDALQKATKWKQAVQRGRMHAPRLVTSSCARQDNQRGVSQLSWRALTCRVYSAGFDFHVTFTFTPVVPRPQELDEARKMLGICDR